MMTRTLAVAVAMLFALPAVADDKFTLSGENTKISFVGTKKDGKHTGGFKTVTGTATCPAKDFTKLTLELDIDCESLFSDDEKLTGHLKSPDFFGTKDNPKATFKITKTENTDKGCSLTGDFTMLGKTKAITVPATIKMDGDTLTITSDFKINRQDWGMSYGKGKIDDDVELKVAVAAKK